MAGTFVPAAAAVILVASTIVYILRPLFEFTTIPGPFLARVSNLWYGAKVSGGHFHDVNIALHRKYGKVVRIGPNHFSIDDPDAVRTIYGPGAKFNKSKWYMGFVDPPTYHVNLFALQDMHQHSMVRRKFANLYAMSTLISYEPLVEQTIDVFHQVLSRVARSGEIIDMTQWFQYYAFDVIGEITFSKRFGFLENGHDIKDIIHGVDLLTIQGTFGGIFTWALPLMYAVFGLLPAGGRAQVTAFVQTRMRERMRNFNEANEKTDSRPPDFLTKALQLAGRDSNGTKPQAEDLIFSPCSANVVAGSDTTSVTLSAVLFGILRHPDVLSKLRRELDEAAADGRASDPITFAESQKLPYLQALLKEAMRVHAATGLPLWRVVPEGGAEIGGHFFPAGANVGVNTWVAHYNPRVFGPDQEAFRPERRIDGTPERLAEMERYFMPFGLGSRTCIGKNISLLEMGKLIPQLLRRYDFEIVDQGKVRLKCYNAWFVKTNEFYVRVRELCET